MAITAGTRLTQISRLSRDNYSPNGLAVEEWEDDNAHPNPGYGPHLRQVPPNLEVLANHHAAAVPHCSTAHTKQQAVADKDLGKKYFL